MSTPEIMTPSMKAIRMAAKKRSVTIAYIPCARRMGLELESVLGEFGQCCHYCGILGRCLIHQNRSVEHGAKVGVEHLGIRFHDSIIHDFGQHGGNCGHFGRWHTRERSNKKSSRPWTVGSVAQGFVLLKVKKVQGEK